MAEQAAMPQNAEDRFVDSLLAKLPYHAGSRTILVGAGGDDCAIIKPPNGRRRWQLLKTDCVIADVHFDADAAPAEVGWKALCRPLSDIAATGGKPRYALVTLALGPRHDAAWALEVYAGLGQSAQAFKVAVVGGDTARTPGPSFLSVCVVGTVRPDRCVTRGGGKVGDALFVTGLLGGSLPSRRHLTFRPRLAEARWLASRFPIHAMMDLSDGLAADLPRLARASGTGFVLERESVPLAEGCSIEQALGDGEDYELLFAAAPECRDQLQRRWKEFFRQVPLTCIGNLAPREITQGLEEARGYDHFAVRKQ